MAQTGAAGSAAGTATSAARTAEAVATTTQSAATSLAKPPPPAADRRRLFPRTVSTHKYRRAFFPAALPVRYNFALVKSERVRFRPTGVRFGPIVFVLVQKAS